MGRLSATRQHLQKCAMGRRLGGAMTLFSDHFSGVAQTYVASRPQYPPTLFDWLARHCPQRQLVWDCATGNGQAAVGLAEHFACVVATDASAAQIAVAESHPRITYQVATADDSGLPDQSADLVAVAQALHWFEPERFYREARRVLRPNGLIAVWTYGRAHLANPDLESVLQNFYERIAPYWPPERAHIETGYRDLPFPFARLDVPRFEMTVQWPLSRVLGYARSWSACKGWESVHGTDAVQWLADQLTPLWGPEETCRDVVWPLTVMAATVSDDP
jgi:SAM-dependent methyltransferase